MGPMLYDMLNQITLNSKLASYSSSERDLLFQQLNKIKKGDMLLLVRSYPCFWLLFLIKAKRIEFCVRLKEDWWLNVKEFTENDEKERIVSCSLPKKDCKKLADFPHMMVTAIQCRLIKVVLENGEKRSFALR
jgi:hypothetical protein